jgi:hypothetical protein
MSWDANRKLVGPSRKKRSVGMVRRHSPFTTHRNRGFREPRSPVIQLFAYQVVVRLLEQWEPIMHSHG